MNLNDIKKIYYKGNEVNLASYKGNIVWTKQSYRWEKHKLVESHTKYLKLQRDSSQDIYLSSGSYNLSKLARHYDSDGRNGYGLQDRLFSDPNFEDTSPMWLPVSNTNGKRLYHDNDRGDSAWFSFHKRNSSDKFQVITGNNLNSAGNKYSGGAEGTYVTKEFKGYFDTDGDFRAYNTDTIMAYKIVYKRTNTTRSMGEKIGIVESTERHAYPDNSWSGGYWYKYIGEQ